ncbi:hypothetical protein AVEN_62820-1 [Araneus ventricosus]|uniref:Uncharacterized protein n=1 Tax=Araneus ventricosus TaxID=182803 RepID=A0A4Y2S555_ARAVE|nr:hypothetical protein AVEN_62820-1 [Araneus ventricosus]
MHNGPRWLLVMPRLRNRRVPGSKPYSTEDPPCMGHAAGLIIHSAHMHSRWCGAEVWKVMVPAQATLSSGDRGSKLRGPSQNRPSVPSKPEANITKPSQNSYTAW